MSMKYGVVIFAVIVVFFQWGNIRNMIDPPPDFAAAHGGKVILYATSWCGYCAKARKVLADNKIDYYEYDIEKSEEGSNQYKRLGGVGIPLLLIGGETVKGFNEERIVRLAKQLKVNTVN